MRGETKLTKKWSASASSSTHVLQLSLVRYAV
jgi:hypothetical protein